MNPTFITITYGVAGVGYLGLALAWLYTGARHRKATARYAFVVALCCTWFFLLYGGLFVGDLESNPTTLLAFRLVNPVITMFSVLALMTLNRPESK